MPTCVCVRAVIHIFSFFFTAVYLFQILIAQPERVRKAGRKVDIHRWTKTPKREREGEVSGAVGVGKWEGENGRRKERERELIRLEEAKEERYAVEQGE